MFKTVKLSPLIALAMSIFAPDAPLGATEIDGFLVRPAEAPKTMELEAAPIYLPEILRHLRGLRPPERVDKPQIKVTRGIVGKSIPHRFLKHASVESLHGGSTEDTPALFLARGTVSIRELSKSGVASKLVKCQGHICDLNAPLFVGKDATLIIDGVTLRMHRGKGAFLVSLGTLYIARSHVFTPFEADCAFESPYTSFRPFIAAMTGSHTVALSSTFTDLGYHAPKAYGFSVHAGKSEAPPSAVLAGNVFEGLYYGFYSHHARDVSIVGNIYRDNIIYGIDPHDYSENLHILGNRAYGTKKKHGIVISRGVTGTTISGNLSYKNNGTGIMLDRHSNGNLVSFNVVSENGIDGISILESSDSRIVGNTAFENVKAGLRVRNGRELLIAKNNVISNGAFGTILYSGEPNGVARRKEDVFELRTNATLISNYVTGNGTTDLQLKGCVDRIAFDLTRGRQPGFIDREVGLPSNPAWRAVLTRLRDTSGSHATISYACPDSPGLITPAGVKKSKGKRGMETCSPTDEVLSLN